MRAGAAGSSSTYTCERSANLRESVFRFAGAAIRMHFRPRHSHPFEHSSVVIVGGGGGGGSGDNRSGFQSLGEENSKASDRIELF